MRAIVTGATGLIGKELLRQLLEDNRFERIVVFARRSTGLISSKLEEHFISFDDLRPYYDYFRGDVMFCALGTTMAKAGSRENFRKVDYTYILNFAAAASAMGVKHFLMVSSIGANAKSKNFYLRTKGETEEAILKSGINRVTIMRPSMLTGEREERRAAEKAGILFARSFGFIFSGPFRKYRPVAGKVVAGRMIEECFSSSTGNKIIESEEI